MAWKQWSLTLEYRRDFRVYIFHKLQLRYLRDKSTDQHNYQLCFWYGTLVNLEYVNFVPLMALYVWFVLWYLVILSDT